MNSGRSLLRITSGAALVALALAGGGCRDALVDPAPIPAQPPSLPELNTMYLKGPTELAVGDTAQFRGEPLDGVSYTWLYNGTGALRLLGSSHEQGFSAVATRAGAVTIGVAAYRDGAMVARAEKNVAIR